MKGREIFPYVTSKVLETLEIRSYKKALADFQTCDMNPVLVKGMAGFDSAVKFTVPLYRRVIQDFYDYERRCDGLFALRALGSAGLDFGIDVMTVVLLFRGNPVGAVLLKGGYNFACSVVPDALSSIKNRFGAKASNINSVE